MSIVGGVISILITLLHDSQEMAIMSGYDTLDLTILEETYKKPVIYVTRIY